MCVSENNKNELVTVSANWVDLVEHYSQKDHTVLLDVQVN